MNNPYIIACDIETDGFSHNKNNILELAGVIAVKKNNQYEIIDQFCQRCRPYDFKHWSVGAEKIHKITMSEAKAAQHPRKMLINFMKFLKPYKAENNDPILFIDHSKNRFDYKFIKHLFMKEELLQSFWRVFKEDHHKSTVDLIKKYQHILGLPDAKLSTAADYFNIELDHHNALSDAIACIKLFQILENYKIGIFDLDGI